MISRIRSTIQRDGVTMVLLVVLLAAAMPLTLAKIDTNQIMTLPCMATDKERTDYVQHSLCSRLEYVLSGRRGADFADWIQDQGGEAKIFSMHGVDVDFDTLEQQQSKVPAIFRRQRHNDPFLPDKMDLDLPPASVHGGNVTIFYKGTVKQWDSWRPTLFQLGFRSFRLGLHFMPVVSTTWLAFLSKNFRHKVWYRWVATSLASSGAAFIKWGQWASTRSDMFPIELCNELSELHSSAPEHSWDFTQSLVESSLDIPQGSLLEVFATFDPQPLASGSIAQVHKARLKNGHQVAVKVRHPRVAQLIDMDFRLMTIFAKVCDLIPALSWLHIKDSVSQFSHTMAAQAHLNVEGHHLEVLNHNFKSWPHVRFPQPFFASASIIMETFEPGKIVTDIIEGYDSQAATLDTDTKGYELMPLALSKFLVTAGVGVYLKMLLVDNLMHADLHPGNIMIDVRYDDSTKASSVSSKQAITLVDAGMVAQLTDEESSNFIGLIICLGEGDGRKAAEFALRFSVENGIDDERKQLFVNDMETLFAETCRGYGTDVNVGNVLRGVLSLINEHRVRIDANYATLVINVLCIESMGNSLCPTYNVLDASKPLLETYHRVCFEKDGITPRRNARLIKRVKRLMPIMYKQKDRRDDLFFKRIKEQRKQQQTQ